MELYIVDLKLIFGIIKIWLLVVLYFILVDINLYILILEYKFWVRWILLCKCSSGYIVFGWKRRLLKRILTIFAFLLTHLVIKYPMLLLMIQFTVNNTGLRSILFYYLQVTLFIHVNCVNSEVVFIWRRILIRKRILSR